jgi:uncharacterized membrane protein YqjE
MKRILATRYGFFTLAALVCWALVALTDAQFRWVPLWTGVLYAVLAVLFLAEEISRSRHSRDDAE